MARMCRVDRPGWLAAGIILGDAMLNWTSPGLAMAGAIDESAHVATTLLIGGASIKHMDGLERAGAYLGSMAIDVDHVPLLVLKLPMESAEDRPVTHSLVTILALTSASLLVPGRPRHLLKGLVAGTISHFLRDLATGGVPLAWPFSRRLVKVPYVAYAALLLALAIRASGDNRGHAGAQDARSMLRAFQPVSH